MSLRLGDKIIAGIGTHTKYNAHSLLDFKWTDHILNEMSWLRADTFSWQSGDVYKVVYEHLVNDWNNYTTITNEQINSITNDEGTFVLRNCPDGHRITDNETAVARSYETGGTGWYFVLDIPNKRFKLPRTKWGFVGVRPNGVAGGYVDESLPNIKGELAMNADRNVLDGVSGSFYYVGNSRTWATNSGASATSLGDDVRFDASRSSSTYQDNAPVQQRATQMYLYFYVGEFSQTAIEQTAGLNSELFNGKADVSASNFNSQGKSLISGLGMPSNRYIYLTLGASGSFYTAPANGWLHIAWNGTNNDGYCSLDSFSTNKLSCDVHSDVNYATNTLAVKKGTVVVMYYRNLTVRRFVFIYAEGEN